MSSTGTGVKTQTEVGAEVNVASWTQTYNFVANETATFLLNYIDHRNLEMEKLLDMREKLEDAIWTYLSSGHLTRVVVEVYSERTDELHERFDLTYDITSPDDLSQSEIEDMNEANFQSYHEEVMENLRRYDPPPEDCTYRILVGYRKQNDIGEPPPDLDGWTTTSPRDVSDLRKESLGDAIDGGPVDAAAELYV